MARDRWRMVPGGALKYGEMKFSALLDFEDRPEIHG